MHYFRDKNTMHLARSRRLTDAHSSGTSSDMSMEENSDSSVDTPLPAGLTRTALLILDYMQFKAARTIQRHWRGFRSRETTNSRRRAAITIQRWWRGYYVRKNFCSFIKNKLQKTLLEHYNKAAIKIQALFRGWWVRQTVHDMTGLRRMQNCAAEDLLHCIAFKLHHLMRTYSIPGIYSLRNSNCLSRVEKLLASINYRFHNGRAHSNMLNRQAMLDKHRNHFKEAASHTRVPFSGPNYKGACDPRCEYNMAHTKDMDRRMFKIIEAYDETQREVQREARARNAKYNVAERKRRRLIKKILDKKAKNKLDFCGDVIASMRRWNIWDNNNLTIGKDIFRNTENLHKFLDEVFEILAELKQCHCNLQVHDEVICH